MHLGLASKHQSKLDISITRKKAEGFMNAEKAVCRTVRVYQVLCFLLVVEGLKCNNLTFILKGYPSIVQPLHP